MPPACEMTEAQLKQVAMVREKSAATGEPSAYCSASGTTVQPRRTPVKPAYLENEHVSIATCKWLRVTTKTRRLTRLGQLGASQQKSNAGSTTKHTHAQWPPPRTAEPPSKGRQRRMQSVQQCG